MRKVFGFAWRFALAYGVAVALWVTVLEGRYNDYLARTCTRLLAAVEQPRLTRNIRRQGNLLVVDHVSHFAGVPSQEIVMRRVDSNSSLFAALTLATPGVSLIARGVWLVGGGALLSASHVGHVISYVQSHYALRNVGPYFTKVQAGELKNLGVRELWKRPAARKRAFVLALANLFNIVLQRVIPIALWLPLFFGARRHQDSPRSGGGWGRERQLAIVACAVALALGGILLAFRQRTYEGPTQAVERVRLGMGAVRARRLLEKQGYVWARSWLSENNQHGYVVVTTDIWPRRGPFTERRYGSRFNWIGLQTSLPLAGPGGVFSACVTGIRTAPSDSRRERYRLAARDPASVCQSYWDSLGPQP